jgi:hypothetical protein
VKFCILTFCSAGGARTAGCHGSGHKLTETAWIETTYRTRTIQSDENSYAALTPLSLVVDISVFRVGYRNLKKLLFHSSRPNTPSNACGEMCVCVHWWAGGVESGTVTAHRTYVISRTLNGTAFGVHNTRTAIICITMHHINAQYVPRSKHTPFRF